MCYRSGRPSLDIDGGVVVARALGKVGLRVGRHERANGLAGLAGSDPGALVGRHHTRRYGVADDDRQDDIAELIPYTNTLRVFQSTRRGIDRIDEQWRRLARLATKPQ